MSGCGPLQHIMGWLSSVGCFEAAADSFLLDIWEDCNFGFGSYEPLQHSIAWGGCPQLGGFEAACCECCVGAIFYLSKIIIWEGFWL